MSNIYTGTMGMISYMNKLNTISNNIANSQTNGYKSDELTFKVFEESFKRVKVEDENKRIGTYKDQVYVDNLKTNFDPGQIKLTDRKLDFTLVDTNPQMETSFFRVKHNDQEYLSRNGHFKVDAEGYLSTMNKGFVLDTDGDKINIPKGVEFSVDGLGNVVNSKTGDKIAELQIDTVEQQHLGYLEKKFGGFFKVTSMEDLEKNYGSVENIIERFDSNITIRNIFQDVNKLEEILQTGNVDILNEFDGELKSNMLEKSNVEISEQMTDMVRAQKGLQASQKVVRAFDSINEKAANEIAR